MLVYEPSEMLCGFHHPNLRLMRSHPRNLFAATRPMLRRRPKLFLMVDHNSERLNRQVENESESELEDNFNDCCPACERRKLKNVTREEQKEETKEKSETAIPVQFEEKNEEKKFSVRLNVKGVEPDNIKVKIKDRWLEIEARSEEKNESIGTFSYRQLHKKFALPDYVNPDHVTSYLDKDGCLSIEALRKNPEQTSLKDNGQDQIEQTANKQPTMDQITRQQADWQKLIKVPTSQPTSLLKLKAGSIFCV